MSKNIFYPYTRVDIIIIDAQSMLYGIYLSKCFVVDIKEQPLNFDFIGLCHMCIMHM